ncbi:hypothetical protein GCM10020000_61340 [Streptomyces olivoverticillatus]
MMRISAQAGRGGARWREGGAGGVGGAAFEGEGEGAGEGEECGGCGEVSAGFEVGEAAELYGDGDEGVPGGGEGACGEVGGGGVWLRVGLSQRSPGVFQVARSWMRVRRAPVRVRSWSPPG